MYIYIYICMYNICMYQHMPASRYLIHTYPHVHRHAVQSDSSSPLFGHSSFTRFMLGVLGGILICAGAMVLYKQFVGKKRDVGHEVGDRSCLCACVSDYLCVCVYMLVCVRAWMRACVSC